MQLDQLLKVHDQDVENMLEVTNDLKVKVGLRLTILETISFSRKTNV